MTLKRNCGLIIVCWCVLAMPLWGGTIYSSGFDGTQLVAIDTVTGAGTAIGSFGTTATYGTAFSTNGVLYTMTDSYNTTSKLATVNLTTGAATVFGASTGIAEMMVMEFSNAGTLYTASWATNSLYTMNATTGVATLVGALGFGGVMDFAFDSFGTLYAVAGSDIYTVNTTTGLGTLAKSTTGTDGCMMGLAFDVANSLYATSYCSTNSPLWKIDLGTGAASVVGLTGISALHGGDIYTGPEPGTWLTLAAGLGVLALLRRRS